MTDEQKQVLRELGFKEGAGVYSKCISYEGGNQEIHAFVNIGCTSFHKDATREDVLKRVLELVLREGYFTGKHKVQKTIKQALGVKS